MCLRRAPEKYIAGAALDRAGLDNVGSSTSQNPIGLQGLLWEQLYCLSNILYVNVQGPEIYILNAEMLKCVDKVHPDVSGKRLMCGTR
jgi:hypothetical protein